MEEDHVKYQSCIRPIVICLLQRDDDILVVEGKDTVKQTTFYRPPGGGIEFGETSVQAAQREILEEFGAEIHNVQYKGIIENIFEYQGRKMHELVFVCTAHFVDRVWYSKKKLKGQDGKGPFYAIWKSKQFFIKYAGRLVPDGLLYYLK